MPADTDTANPAPLGMAFGGTVQLIAGILEYNEGNTFGMTAFTSYGAFWWWIALTELFAANGWLSIDTPSLGFALLMWGVFTTYMWIGTLKLSWALWSVFITLSVTFYLLGLGDLFGLQSLLVTGGYVGILTGLLAMYTSFAEVTNWSFDDEVVPLGGAPIGSVSGGGLSADPTGQD